VENNKDLFEKIYEVIDELAEEGQYGYSLSLKDAMSVSTVPGELFGELKNSVLEIARSKVCSPYLQSKVENVLECLNDIWS
jgi:hypothetical protein